MQGANIYLELGTGLIYIRILIFICFYFLKPKLLFHVFKRGQSVKITGKKSDRDYFLLPACHKKSFRFFVGSFSLSIRILNTILQIVILCILVMAIIRCQQSIRVCRCGNECHPGKV